MWQALIHLFGPEFAIRNLVDEKTYITDFLKLELENIGASALPAWIDCHSYDDDGLTGICARSLGEMGVEPGVVPELIKTGTYAHPWLGISMLDINPTTAKILREAGMDVPIDHGVLIMQVSPGSPADEAGLKSGDSEVRVGNMIIPIGGDIIIALDENPIECFQDLTVYMETEVIPGESVLLTILRDGVMTDVLTVPIAQP